MQCLDSLKATVISTFYFVINEFKVSFHIFIYLYILIEMLFQANQIQKTRTDILVQYKQFVSKWNGM